MGGDLLGSLAKGVESYCNRVYCIRLQLNTVQTRQKTDFIASRCDITQTGGEGGEQGTGQSLIERMRGRCEKSQKILDASRVVFF